ncbi:MAG: XRE family transcriptional regulator, partial [Chloroflexi bacterium]|nr:XRE family transcriptional regulator [Chloroflexota bacterium]
MAALSASLDTCATCGELLKFLRRRARLSQRELSIAIGYSESHISRIENNERPIDRSSLLALFVPALDIQNEPETIARLLALCEQAQPLPADNPPGPVLSQPAPGAQPANRNHLPAQLTSFVGRREEVAELRDLLADRQTRLLTLTGAGGCGKTRLALRVGEEMAHAYSHGVWLVELAPLADPQLLVREVASTFDLRESTDHPLLSALADFLHPRQALLILDNCEHLVDMAAHLAATLLQACPTLQILATSRENLAIPGETNYPIHPLALPPALRG